MQQERIILTLPALHEAMLNGRRFSISSIEEPKEPTLPEVIAEEPKRKWSVDLAGYGLVTGWDETTLALFELPAPPSPAVVA